MDKTPAAIDHANAPEQTDRDKPEALDIGPVVETYGCQRGAMVKLFGLAALASGVAVAAGTWLVRGGSATVAIFLIALSAMAAGFLANAAAAAARLRLELGELGLRLNRGNSEMAILYRDVTALKLDDEQGAEATPETARALRLVLPAGEQLRLTDELSPWPDIVAAVTQACSTAPQVPGGDPPSDPSDERAS